MKKEEEKIQAAEICVKEPAICKKKATSCGNGYFDPPLKMIFSPPPHKKRCMLIVGFKGGVKPV